MSFMNKVKNFFYEDVEEDPDIPVVEEPKKKFNLFKKEPKVEEVEKPIEEVKDVKQEVNNDLSERELFKAERTFNFPMDLGDEIFDEDEIVEETKEVVPVRTEPVKEQTYTRSIYHNISKEETKREEKKKFKPSPVISPVYGILDKNYTVDDVVEADKTKEFSFDKKMVDFDSVRNRAYKDLDEELERTMNTESLYKEPEETKVEIPEEEPVDEPTVEIEEPSVIITYDEIEEDPVPVEAEEVEFKEAEVKDVVAELEPELDEEDIAPDVKIEPKRSRRSKKEEPKEQKEKEDLFNLIDNMYNEDEEEDDE